jgi:hypothetical protein
MHTSRAGLSQRESSTAFNRLHLQVRNSYSSTDHTSSNAAAISFFKPSSFWGLWTSPIEGQKIIFGLQTDLCVNLFISYCWFSSDFNFGEYIISEILFWRYYVFDSLVIFKSENAKELIITWIAAIPYVENYSSEIQKKNEYNLAAQMFVWTIILIMKVPLLHSFNCAPDWQSKLMVYQPTTLFFWEFVSSCSCS